MNISGHTELLQRKGVLIPNPTAVDIDAEIDPARISGEGVVFYPGTRIYGADTVISAGVKLGYEGPVTIENCQLGSRVQLKGGFFSTSVFLDGCTMGNGAHVRQGCLLEEETRAGHTVGLKQTILFPFVTLGSLINFCDCFMAGGTDRKNHSEVGSSYIHFNYTPQQDKATASLIGDVPQGVMLRQKPIFLGGQGGLIGPARIAFGTVIAAGTIFRGDCTEDGKFVSSGANKDRLTAYHPGLYVHISRRIRINLSYMANLLALKQWYIHVRQPFFLKHALAETVHQGALNTLDAALHERLLRMDELAEKMDESLAQVSRHLKGQQKKLARGEQEAFRDRWPEIRGIFEAKLEESLGADDRHRFLTCVDQTATRHQHYLAMIRALPPEAVACGKRWLGKIVTGISTRGESILSGETGGP
ncbi:MAG: UDP-N-acetylglucosamine pyrophosphorylase [Syntrophales bacterium]|jgi:UDP-N-acetylglucosamine/UDP-N-acetylgalactosamine diphosphorylase|nr:UDP-N-acetylglucosamine pyrophosphorylase [Syntrophales bacterium]